VIFPIYVFTVYLMFYACSDEDISPLTVAIYGFVYISSANSAVVVSLTYWIYVFYADEGTGTLHSTYT
jgi:hypothetical protein